MDDLTAIIQENEVRVFSDGETTEDIIAALIGERIIDDAPVFVVDIGTVKRSFERWTELLPGVNVFFAMKSNSDPVILKVLAALGSGFDVASHGEISAALQHAPPDKLVYANPVKHAYSLSYARQVDVDLLVFDSSNELIKTALFHPQAELLLRLRVDDTGSACRFGSKFGAEKEDVPSLLALAKTLGLSVVGVSFHVGSGCSNPNLFASAIELCLDTFMLAEEVGIKLTTIDVGGGFTTKTLEDCSAVVRPFVERHPELRFVAEPGRLLVEDCATLVVSVIGKKRAKASDGEYENVIYINESVYSMFNLIVFDHRKVELQPFNEREGALFRTKVYGHTCDSIDLVSEECMLPDLAVGERLFVRHIGAYSSASAASGFNGFSTPKTVYVLTTV